MFRLRRLLTGESGASMMEYAVLIALIAIALMAAVLVFRNGLQGLYQQAADEAANAISGPPSGGG
ncbi:MAG TPA: Flp family type IVb pilin [Gammaproteobacteria bacterium]|nr:Flp family type IVb pilin [Gammaproteobacteria bacterium]